MICLMAQWIARPSTVQKVAGSNLVILNIQTGHFEKFELEWNYIDWSAQLKLNQAHECYITAILKST